MKVGEDVFNGETSGFQAAQAMHAIVREMKEIPELLSDNPGDDVTTLDKVTSPEEGGVLTYLTNEQEPYRGFPFFEMVEKIDTMKKIIRGQLSSLYHSVKGRNKLILLTLIFVPWLVSDLVKAQLYAFYRIVLRFKIKPKYYSQPMRELYRAFGVWKGEQSEQLRDLVCMVLEMDNAYRFRLQDVLVEIDKHALKKNLSKELVRLLSIMQSRELGQDVKDTWTLFKTFLPVYLFLNGEIRRNFVSVLLELNLNEIALSKEDKWFAYPRKDYVCGFRSKPTEEDNFLIERIKANLEKKEARIKVRKESTKTHEELFAKQAQELTLAPETDAIMKKEIEDMAINLQKEHGEEFDQKRRLIIDKHLTPEQLFVLKRQRGEIDEMDKVFNEKLSAVENIQ